MRFSKTKLTLCNKKNRERQLTIESKYKPTMCVICKYQN